MKKLLNRKVHKRTYLLCGKFYSVYCINVIEKLLERYGKVPALWLKLSISSHAFIWTSRKISHCSWWEVFPDNFWWFRKRLKHQFDPSLFSRRPVCTYLSAWSYPYSFCPSLDSQPAIYKHSPVFVIYAIPGSFCNLSRPCACSDSKAWFRNSSCRGCSLSFGSLLV